MPRDLGAVQDVEVGDGDPGPVDDGEGVVEVHEDVALPTT